MRFHSRSTESPVLLDPKRRTTSSELNTLSRYAYTDPIRVDMTLPAPKLLCRFQIWPAWIVFKYWRCWGSVLGSDCHVGAREWQLLSLPTSIWQAQRAPLMPCARAKRTHVHAPHALCIGRQRHLGIKSSSAKWFRRADPCKWSWGTWEAPSWLSLDFQHWLRFLTLWSCVPH